MRYVPIKTIEQQGISTLHRMRQGWVEERTALANRLRGLLAEFDLPLAKGVRTLHSIPELMEDAENKIPGAARCVLLEGWEHFALLSERITKVELQIQKHASSDERAKRIMAVPGIGPLTASAVIAAVGNAHEFRNARQFAAWLGLTPRQNSSGGKTQLGEITRRGDVYLRMLLVLGARSAFLTAARRTDRASRWLVELEARLGWRKALVALANKHARIIWTMLTRNVEFDANHVPPCFAMSAA